MPSIEKISIRQAVETGKAPWRRVLEDTRPGVSPDEVFARLKRKYQAMAEAAETGPSKPAR